jgi:glycosyltransferase involved in cell wall biosynthesis
MARTVDRQTAFLLSAEREVVQRFFVANRVTVVLAEYLDFSFRWMPVAQNLGIRWFAHAHGYDVSRCLRDDKWRRKYLEYNNTDGIITMSHTSRARLISLGIRPEKIYVAYYGVDIPDAVNGRRTGKRLVAVGRMVTKKAPLMTLRAFHRASQIIPDLTLDYVGFGELLDDARKFVAETGLEGRVRLLGGRSPVDVHKLLQQSDIFVQHSVTDRLTGDEEGLPVSILEAMSFGLPVVSTCHAGIPEAVAHGVNGYLVQENDWESMAERVVELARDSVLRNEMGQRARERVKSLFSWEAEKAALHRILGIPFA